MKLIQLYKHRDLIPGLFTEVDDEDYPELIRKRWHLVRSGGAKIHNWYVGRWERRAGGRSLIYIHRSLMHADKDTAVLHRDGNSKNNQKSNLSAIPMKAMAWHKQGWAKKGPGPHYKGVVRYEGKRKTVWRTIIFHEHVRYYLGTFDTPEAAAEAYNSKASELSGEYATLNIIPEPPKPSLKPLRLPRAE